MGSEQENCKDVEIGIVKVTELVKNTLMKMYEDCDGDWDNPWDGVIHYLTCTYLDNTKQETSYSKKTGNIFDFIVEKGGTVTRSDIDKKFGILMSKERIDREFEILEKKNMIEIVKGKSTGGRPPTIVKVIGEWSTKEFHEDMRRSDILAAKELEVMKDPEKRKEFEAEDY